MFGNRGTAMPSTLSKKRALEETTNINLDDDNEDVANEPCTRKSRNKLKTQHYKQLSEKNFWWVPRERYIKQKVAEFLKPIENTDVEFAPYCAQMNSSDPMRASMFQQVDEKAHHVSCFTPSMTNGRLKKGKIIHRAFVSKIKGTNNITGAVSIEINLDTRYFEVVAIHVDDKLQRKKLGSYLFHTAILIGLLYGCENVYCRSTSTAKDFYRKHGFVGEDEASVDNAVSESAESNSDEESDGECFNLNFLEDAPRNQFISVVKKWNPSNTMEELINQVRSNVNSFDQNEKLLTDMIKADSDFRPTGSDFPAMAFLACFANRNQASEISISDEDSSSEDLPVNNQVAYSATSQSVTDSATPITSANSTPMSPSCVAFWKPWEARQRLVEPDLWKENEEVVDPDLSWLDCLNT